MNGEEEELRGIPAVDRLVLSLHFMVVPPPHTHTTPTPPKEGLTDYLSLPFQMHLGICEYYLPLDNVVVIAADPGSGPCHRTTDGG